MSKQEQKQIKHTHSKWTIASFVLVVVLAVASIVSLKACNPGEVPELDNFYADISVRGYGVITVQLDYKNAPETVGNFISLVQQDFYDDLTFHRIIEGFMMQGGDPNGDGTGGSGKTIKGEFSLNGVNNTLSHTRGAISMARQGDNPFTEEHNYDSASSQFFIVQQDCSADLDGKYAVFGYVIEGMDVVDAICADARPIDGNGTIAPEDQPIIGDIEIYQ